jgi:protein-tyrosine-phosphatase
MFGLRDACRGIIIVGATNTARTLMAEAYLRRALGDSVFIQSSGDEHVPGGGAAATLHPMALRVMEESDPALGDELRQLRSKVLTRRHRFDVLVRILDAGSPVDWTAASRKHAFLDARRVAAESSNFTETDSASADPVLAHPSSYTADEAPFGLAGTPAHWQVRSAVGTIKRTNRLWSTDDDVIADPNNTKHRLSDEYQGEPLFESRSLSGRRYRLEKAWVLDKVSERRPMEREGQQLNRFRKCRDEIARNVDVLLADLRDQFAAADVQQASSNADEADRADARMEIEELLPGPPKGYGRSAPV